MKPDSADLRLERLNAGEATELQRALVDAQRRLPDAQQLAALAAHLSTLGLPVQPLTAASPALPPATAPWRLWFAGGVVGCGLVALLLWRTGGARPKALTVAPPLSFSSSELISEPRPSAPGQSALSSTRPLGSSASPVPTAPDVPSAPPATASTPGDTFKSPAGLAASSRPAPQSAVALASARPGAHSPTSTERANAVANAPGAVAPPSELALLRDAQLALRTNPAQALALTEQHQARFARGAMVQERELIAISALARLGRRSAVLARAAQFARDFPSSPYGKQIEALAQ